MNQVVTIGKSGHLVIPSEYCQALNFKEGDEVVMMLKNGHLELFPTENPIIKAQARVRKYLKPDNNLVEMLFEDRKKEFANE